MKCCKYVQYYSEEYDEMGPNTGTFLFALNFYFFTISKSLGTRVH